MCDIEAPISQRHGIVANGNHTAPICKFATNERFITRNRGIARHKPDSDACDGGWCGRKGSDTRVIASAKMRTVLSRVLSQKLGGSSIAKPQSHSIDVDHISRAVLHIDATFVQRYARGTAVVNVQASFWSAWCSEA